ncbi:MAG: hypothetical protein QG622_1220 [Actinomycetota bacterium]|nr:hypothetical protein [Actinomycetota bacterium]
MSTAGLSPPTANVLPRSSGSGRHRGRQQLAVTAAAGAIGLAGIIAALLIPGGKGLAGIGLDGVDLPFGMASPDARQRVAGPFGGTPRDAAEEESILAMVPPAPPSAPVFLPEEVAGLSRLPLADDPTLTPDWRKQAAEAAAGATITVRTYGTADGRETVRTAAARTDLAGKLHLTWPADGGTRVGDNRCTQYVRPAPGAEVKVRDGVVICWRISSRLSAYALLISTEGAVTLPEGSAALDQIWDTASAR